MIRKTLIIIAAALLLFSCSKEEEAKPELRPVYTVEVPPATNAIIRSFSGSLKAASASDISFEVGGRIIDLPVKEGQEHKKGEVLAKIDCTEYEAQLLDAEGLFQQAAGDLQRKQLLFENGNASKQELDAALAGHSTAKAKLNTAKKKVRDCVLKMPFDGKVGQVYVDNQQTVAAGDGVVRVLGESGMEMVVGVPEDYIDRFQVGLPGKVSVNTIPENTFSGNVTEVSQNLSEGGTYNVTLKVNEEHEKMRDGMAGETEFAFTTGGNPVISVPFECVAGGPDGRYVWIVTKDKDGKTGKVTKRNVTAGQMMGDRHIHIVEGLKTGELIVSRGVHVIEDGIQVSILG